jgi:hypothetical protein
MLLSTYDQIGTFAHIAGASVPSGVPKWVVVACPTKAVYTSGGVLSAVLSGPQEPRRVNVSAGTSARMFPLDVY